MDPFRSDSCQATFNLTTHGTSILGFSKESFSLPCDEAQRFLKAFPPERNRALHRIDDLELTQGGKVYIYKKDNTPNLTALKIDLFQRNLLPSKTMADD